MMARPLVSIVMPTFNRQAFLPSTVQTVMEQTLQDWELIIADDGSDAPVLEYLASLENDRRVRLLRLPHSGNPGVSRNAGIAAARATFVAFMDSDDLWAAHKLERQLAQLAAEPDRAWCYSAFAVVDGNNVPPASERNRPWTPHSGHIFAEIVRCTASICTPSVVVRKELLTKVGAFDPTIDVAEDYDLWMRLALESPVCVVDEPLVRVRRHPENLRRPLAAPYTARDYSLRKLADTLDGAERKLVDEERSRNALALAAATYRSGRRWRSLAVLARSAPFAWKYPRWWYGGAKALARACLGYPRRSHA
jgi:glycosyltransferase involved in cell wall biosynthesis